MEDTDMSTDQMLQLEEDRLCLDLKALIDTARSEDRGLTEDEKKTYAELEKKHASVNARRATSKRDDGMRAAIQELVGGGNGNGNSGLVVSRFGGMKSFGARFTESEAFAWLKKTKPTRSGQWTSPSTEIDRIALFATVTEDPASGGALVVPDYRPGIVPGATLRIVVADLFAPGTTTSNTVHAMVEDTFTNAADAVAEGGVKPESSLTFELQEEPVRKLAHWIPATEEFLEDAPQSSSYIDARLRYGLLRKEDQQLLSGDGVAPELEGVLVRSGLAADVVRADPATNADAILEQIITIEAATGLPVSGIVMNPLNWGAIVGVKDDSGNYIGGGPFTVLPRPTLWGRDVALTDQIAAGTALVGAFKAGGQVFRHGGIKVAMTNSHSDYFIKNLVAIRAEERLALAIYRPAAFGKVTSLTTL
jgi:HK97 family phage major capsid protein